MVSHAWDEYYRDFSEAIVDAGVAGPFWVCAFAIYQPEDLPEVSIVKQLGPDVARGPFAHVLHHADSMLAVVTTSCNIYTRMWCVFEMYVALQRGVPVKMFGFAVPVAGMCGIRSGELINDPIRDATCEAVDTKSARCGAPNLPQNDDEKAIRQCIELMPGGYVAIDEAIEKERLRYLQGVLDSDELQERAKNLSMRPFTEDPRDVYRNAIKNVQERLVLFAQH
ncbi:unnamed protein product [Effrenium voratum]|nr:unnamed protein product [Effrenium voratum]